LSANHPGSHGIDPIARRSTPPRIGRGSESPPAEAGRVSHPDGALITCTLVIGETLYTVCYRGLGANRPSDLSAIGFTPFG
jgi:hypothetical protein